MEEREHNQSRTELPSAQQTLLTAEDLWKQANDGYRYEIVGFQCKGQDLFV